MELIGAFVVGAALLFNEGKHRHAWGYLIVGAIIFAFLLAGAK